MDYAISTCGPELPFSQTRETPLRLYGALLTITNVRKKRQTTKGTQMSIVEKYVISMCRDPAIDRKKGKRVEIDWKTIINSVVVSGADLML